MAEYVRKKTKKPPLLYGAVRWLFRVFCRIFLGFRVRYEDAVPATGPLMVVGSHAGMMDALFMGAAIKNRRLNFVTTERFFHLRGVGPLFRFFGVIPRIQFQADPRSISTMLRVVKDGGAIGLFPGGQTSMCGVPGYMPPAIARLLKRSGATVVALRLNGSFFTKSRFQSGLNRGKSEGVVSVLFTPAQLESASETDIYAKLCEALHYDDYAWQKESGARYKGRALARGYEAVIYRCPKCGAQYRMESRGDTFVCLDCGSGAKVGRDMHMTPLDAQSVIFPTLRDWYRWQSARIEGEIDDESAPFRMEAPAKAQLYRGSERFEAGGGTLWLDREHIGFESGIGEREMSFSIPHRSLFGMAADTALYLELYHPDLGLVRLLPENGKTVIAFKTAQEYLYSKTMEG